MNCDCKTDIERKLTERFLQTAPDATDHKVELDGYGLVVVDSGLKVAACMTYKATANHPLKKGGAKSKKTTGNMFFSYCPFCGEKA